MSHATCTSDWQELHVETGFYPPVTYLLIDDLHIRRMEGVQRALCEPQKHPEPVVQAQKPWEGEGVWMHNGWLYDRDEKVFKLWYHCHDPSFYDEYPDLAWNYRRAYAVSADALTWEKPELGVVPWQGSTRNNLVDFPPAGGDGPNANVFKNPGDGDPNRRYMSLSSERHPREPGEKAITWPGGPGSEGRSQRARLLPLRLARRLYLDPAAATHHEPRAVHGRAYRSRVRRRPERVDTVVASAHWPEIPNDGHQHRTRS